MVSTTTDFLWLTASKVKSLIPVNSGTSPTSKFNLPFIALNADVPIELSIFKAPNEIDDLTFPKDSKANAPMDFRSGQSPAEIVRIPSNVWNAAFATDTNAGDAPMETPDPILLTLAKALCWISTSASTFPVDIFKVPANLSNALVAITLSAGVASNVTEDNLLSMPANANLAIVCSFSHFPALIVILPFAPLNASSPIDVRAGISPRTNVFEKVRKALRPIVLRFDKSCRVTSA